MQTPAFGGCVGLIIVIVVGASTILGLIALLMTWFGWWPY